MQYGSSSTLELSIGTVKVEVGADGDVERGDELCNTVLTAATTICNFEALRMANAAQNGGALHQEFSQQSTSGKISFAIKISFDLKHQVSNRALNTLVYYEMLPEMWKAIGIFTGDQKAPRPRNHQVVLGSIDATLAALGLEGVTGPRRAASLAGSGNGNGRQGQRQRPRAGTGRR